MNCGTLYGYGQHKAANTPACQYCKSAKAKHDAGILEAAPTRTPRAKAQCGTASAYTLHLKRGETPCDPCREAAAEYSRQRRAKQRNEKPAVGRTLKPCGTYAAYVRHRKNKEEPCEPCYVAVRARAAENNPKRRTAAKKKAEVVK